VTKIHSIKVLGDVSSSGKTIHGVGERSRRRSVLLPMGCDRTVKWNSTELAATALT